MGRNYSKNALNYEITQYLNAKIIQTFKAEYEQKNKKSYEHINDSLLYGYGKNDGDDIESIRTYLCQNSRVRKIVAEYAKHKKPSQRDPKLFIEGNYLWKKNYEARKKPSEKIPFTEFYLKIFLAYIEINLHDLEQEYAKSFSYYIGYYMSFTGFNIKTLLFRISLSTDEKNQHELDIEGVHHKMGAVNIDTYNGKVWREEGWLYGYGKGQKYPHKRLSLMGSVDSQGDIMSNENIKVMLNGITFDNERIIGWEVVLHRIDLVEVQKNRLPGINDKGPIDPLAIGKQKYEHIALYLVSHRNVSSFRTQSVDDILSLKAKNIPVKNFYNIIGNYVLWNFDFDFKNIIQSSLSILSENIGTLKTNIPAKNKPTNNPEKISSGDSWRPTDGSPSLQYHNALINISRANEKERSIKIVIITFDKIDIVNVAMFEFPTDKVLDPDKIITGAFSSLGDPLHGSISGYFAMKKVPLADIPVKIIPLETAIKVAKEDDQVPLLKAFLSKNSKYYTQLDQKIKKNINDILGNLGETVSQPKEPSDILPDHFD